jgi:hypothetical protein
LYSRPVPWSFSSIALRIAADSAARLPHGHVELPRLQVAVRRRAVGVGDDPFDVGFGTGSGLKTRMERRELMASDTRMNG